MATYGGGPNPPVRLDPWQNITNVSWPGFYLSCSLAIVMDDDNDQEGACSPQAPETGTGFWWDAWKTTVDYAYATPDDPATLFAAHARSGGAAISGVTVSGLPALPTQAGFGTWERASPSSPVWETPAAAPLVLDGYPTIVGYYNTLTASVHRTGQPFTGAITRCGAFGFPAREVAAHAQTYTFSNGATEYASSSMSVAGMTLEFEGRTYEAIAVKPVSSTFAVEDTVAYDGMRSLSVLFRRQTS